MKRIIASLALTILLASTYKPCFADDNQPANGDATKSGSSTTGDKSGPAATAAAPSSFFNLNVTGFQKLTNSGIANSHSIISLTVSGFNQQNFGYYGVQVLLYQKGVKAPQEVDLSGTSFARQLVQYEHEKTPKASDIEKYWYVDSQKIGSGKTFPVSEVIPIVFYFPNPNPYLSDTVFDLDLQQVTLTTGTQPYATQEGDQIKILFYKFAEKSAEIDQDVSYPDKSKFKKKSDFLLELYKDGYLSIVPNIANAWTLNIKDYGTKITAAPTFLFATKFSDTSAIVSQNLDPTAKAPGINAMFLVQNIDDGSDFGNWLLDNVCPMPSIGAVSSDNGTYKFSPGISMPIPVLNWLPLPADFLQIMRENGRLFVGVEGLDLKNLAIGYTVTVAALDVIKPTNPGGGTTPPGSTSK